MVPSLYEGFSLPAVEHMASGTPLVASRTGALPEVTGDAAVLVAPGDAEELAAALRGLLDSPAERDRLAAAALAAGAGAVRLARRGRGPRSRSTARRWRASPPGAAHGPQSATRTAVLTVDFARLPVGPGDRVLDLGCGAGRHAFEALRGAAPRGGAGRRRGRAARRWRTWSAAMRRGRRGARPAAAARTRGAATRPGCRSPDGAFDRVIAAEVLEHIPADQAALREIARVLRPGGLARGDRARLAAGADLLAAVRRLPQRARRARPHLHPAPSWRPSWPRPGCGRRPPPRARAALAVLVAEVRGRRARRRSPAGPRLPPAAGLGHHEAAGRDPAGRPGAEPADRQEPRRLRGQAAAGGQATGPEPRPRGRAGACHA